MEEIKNNIITGSTILERREN